MIPKTIHYCWFGRNPKPKLAKKCIKSWKIYCRGYEIIEWNEDNFDLALAPLYVRQAYEAKKWAFVTDYVRLWAMTQYGGIYMDTDVEVVRSLDRFLEHRAFSGFEDDVHIPTGIMACEKDFPLFVEFLRYYDTASFLNEDGSPNLTTNVIIMTEICLKHGLQQNGQYQLVDGFALYPKDVFCPMSGSSGILNKTANTAAIHWFSASWFDEARRQSLYAWRKAERRDRLIHTPNRILIRLLGQDKYNKLKHMLGRK